jgi:hypothetical protein
MIELRYWDFLAVRLSAGHFNNTVYDREVNIRERDLPSVFLGDPDEICRSLSSQGVRFVVLIDEGLKSRVQSMAFLSPISEIGRWSIYEFDLHIDPAKISCNPNGDARNFPPELAAIEL